MTALEIRSNLHKIIDSIQNEQLLHSLYEFLKKRDKERSDGVWNDLTEEQKNYVLKAFDESENDQNLLNEDEMFKRPE